MSRALVIEGGCHCRAIRYELQWPGSEGKPRVPARRCGCSFCTRIDGVWTSHPQANLKITRDATVPATPYRFGTGTADFLFCSRCGMTPLVTCRIDGREYAVVNVNTFDEIEDPGFDLDLSDSDFEGESLDERLARRAARWIGTVEWLEG